MRAGRLRDAGAPLRVGGRHPRLPGVEETNADAAPARTDQAHEGGEHETITGWRVLHLFCRLRDDADLAAIELACKEGEGDGHQVLTAALLGHKADLAVMALGPSTERLRVLQSALRRAGCEPVWSYVSLTEVSEYARGVPEAMREARLHPVLPPAGFDAFCFYPMTKRREAGANWYTLGYEERLSLMYGHGRSGRAFRDRVVQLVTASTGLDDFEWGVTLFGRSLEDIKQCVYSMRFDEASALYGDFGTFVVGVLAPPADVLAMLR